jgi:mannose-1-phosphate guanylyltransferase
MKVRHFTEKPDIELAKVFLESATFLECGNIYLKSRYYESFRKASSRHVLSIEEGKIFTDQQKRVLLERHMLNAGIYH